MVLGLLTTASAHAHAADPDTAVTEYALPDTVRIEGERLSIDPLRVPGAATLLTKDEWERRRLAGIDGVLEQVPGVVAQTRSGAQDVRVTIRGFGARGSGDRSNAGTTRGIRFTLDGFPLTEPDGRTSLDFADPGLMESIRVIRSNSSGLYGPASGGLIDLYSTSKFKVPFVETAAEFGGFGYSRGHAEFGYVSGLSRLNFSISTSDFDGWRDHSGGSQTTIMASFHTDPSPRTSVEAFVSGTKNLQRQPGALTQAEFDEDPRQADSTYEAQNSRRDNRIGRVAVRLTQRIGDGQTLTLGGFVEPKTIHRSERNRFRDFQRAHVGGTALYMVPFTVGTTRVRWTSGLDDAFQDGSVLFYDLAPGGTRSTDLAANQREGINVFGAFTEFAVGLGTRWELTAGGRWDFVHYISEDRQAPELNETRTLDRGSPRAALSYRIHSDHSLYAALSSGIEAPAFNEIDPPAPYDTVTTLNPFLEPAYSTTVEVGAKGKLHFGRGFETVGYDVAIYTLEVNNDIIPWDGGAFYTTAGKSRRSGIELGLSAGSNDGLSGRVSLAATKNRYVDYETGAPDTSGNIVPVRYDDNESAGIPSTVFNASLRYQFGRGPRGPYVEGAYHHIGEYFANDANTDVVEAYNVVDLTVGASHRFTYTTADFFVSGRNLTDETYAASAYVNGANGRYLEPGMERNVLVGVKLRIARAE
jgi:iron complex outermembrane receptor protein